MEGFILAGGKSRRMGTDKSALVVDGKTMLERAASVLASISPDGISVVGGPWDAALGYNLIEDPVGSTDSLERSGPMLGLCGALSAASTEWIAVLACDLPFVSSGLLRTLAAIDRTDADAVVPMQSDGIAQPLCALYRCEPCRRVIGHLMENGDRSMRSLLVAIRTRFVNFEDIKPLRDSENFFLNVNSPDDYDRALSICGSDLRPKQ